MNEITPKISVIVPVYKAEAYLHRCVDSILAQTFQDFEVLLIDDGSPDRSGEICDEYARKDRRVRVFHKENGGVSSARQCGMDNALGEYTIHADPDDWVEPTMLEELYKKAKEEDADMVICDLYRDEKGKSVYISQRPSALDYTTVLHELFLFILYSSCWNKLVKRICYSKFNIKFPLELSNLEDFYVNVCIVSHGVHISYLPRAFYHYVQDINSNSLSHREVERILPQHAIFLQLLEDVLESDLFFKCKIFFKFEEACWILVKGGVYLCNFQNNYQLLKKNLHYVPCSILKKMAVYIALYFSPKFVHFLYVFIHKL